MALRSSSSNSGATNSWTVPVPTGSSAGDVVILIISSDGTGYTSTPSGFTLLAQDNLTIDGQYTSVFTKTLTGADSGTYGASAANANQGWSAAAFCFSGRSGSPAISTTAKSNVANASPYTATANGVTASAGDDLIFLAAPDTTNASNPTSFTPPSGYTTAQFEHATAWASVAGAVKANVAAGATGTVSGTFSGGGSSGWDAWVVRIPGAAAGPNQGSSSGTTAWHGSASGSRTSSGSKAGTVAWHGSASGTTTHSGNAAGGILWTGSAHGVAPANSGHVSGLLTWHGAATGSATHSGSATGTLAWSGTATGTTTHRGSVAGLLDWIGSATGTAHHSGSSPGTVSWVGHATGSAPAAGGNTGSVAGHVSWQGAANGSTAHDGLVSAALSWVGQATGTTQRSAGSTGAIQWIGHATGSATHQGSVSGSLNWAGQAAGVLPPTAGQAHGQVTWTGSAVGTAPYSFSPPYVQEWATDEPVIFRKMRLGYSVTVLKTGSSYRTVRRPEPEEIDAADIAYLGGHVYTISDQEAAALMAAGYEVTR